MMDEEEIYTRQRRKMVREQLIDRGIRDPRVLEVMGTVPRHLFMPEEFRSHAYDDGPLPIGEGQTISQPYIVALMTQYLHLDGDEKVLEVGTGSGYQAAVLACLAEEVHTVEIIPTLAESAERNLRELGIKNVKIHLGDGSAGWIEDAPYQAILVAAAAPDEPKALLDQLDEGGRMVAPVGSRGGQYLYLWQRREGKLIQDQVLPVAFVPLRGEHGWHDEDWD